jgi:hypothetical protein
MATLAIFLVVAGGTAVAANQLAKNSVGTKQLKKNSVTAKKIKKNAVTAAKIKKDAVTSAKLADAGVTGAKIDAAGVPASQVVARLRNGTQVAAPADPILLGTYTQNAGELNQFIGWADLTFAPACTAPRFVQGFLTLDGNPAAPAIEDVIGFAYGIDETGTSNQLRLEFGPYFGAGAMYSPAPDVAVQHSVYLLIVEVECTAGSGATLTGAGIDVIGSR